MWCGCGSVTAAPAHPIVCIGVSLQVVTLQQSEWRRLKTKEQQVAYAFQLSQGVEVSALAPDAPLEVDQLAALGGKARKRPKPTLKQKLLRILLEGK